MAESWRDNTSRYAVPESKSVAPLPDLLPDRCTWGDALLTHFRRASLQARRRLGFTVIINAVTVGGVFGIVVGIPANTLLNEIVQPSFTFWYLMLLQGIMSQSFFGGAERCVAWRESSV